MRTKVEGRILTLFKMAGKLKKIMGSVVLILDYRINNNDVVTNNIMFLHFAWFCIQLYNKVKLCTEFVMNGRSFHVFNLFKMFLDYLRSTSI